MKRMLAMLIFVAILSMISTQAIAETVLVSPPLPPGEGGFTCACANFSKNPLEVEFILFRSNGHSSTILTIQNGFADSYTVSDTAYSRYCQIVRVDGKSVKTKDLACTFSAIDTNGNPTAVVPVDRKFKQ